MTTQYKWLPSEPTEEMLFALYGMYKTLEERYLAAWEAAPVVNQEPYAYATLWDGGEWSVVQDIEQNAIKQVPLYTHPPVVEQTPIGAVVNWGDKTVEPLYTNPQPKREPLSENKAEELITNIIGVSALDKEQFETAMMLFRGAEKAHGIGVE
jgi:hypothetical protein